MRSLLLNQDLNISINLATNMTPCSHDGHAVVQNSVMFIGPHTVNTKCSRGRPR
jgi:hypothetical protein